MNRSVSIFATNAARHHQTATHTMRLLLLCTITVAAFAALYLFIGGSAPKSPTSRTPSASTQSKPRTTAEVREAYGQMPLSFEANRGQADESFNFLARGAGYTLSLSPTSAVFALARQSIEGSPSAKLSERARDHGVATAQAEHDTDTASAPHSQLPQRLLRMNLLGANRGAGVEGLDELEGKVNYMTGNDQTKWRTNIQTFSRVRYHEVYPGIDMVYYGNQRQLEYDFVVAPGKDARAIALEFAGADRVEVSAAGELLLMLGESIVRQPKPLIYQEVAGARHTVEGGYMVENDGRVGFTLGDYDPTLPLVIDPVLVYSTYFGGSGSEQVRDIAVDAAGNAYVCGDTTSTNFPTVNAFDASFNPGNSATDSDAFVAKLNAAGTAIVYSTYLGGTGADVNLSGTDICYGITVDSGGNAYVTGQTRSTNFPTANPIQATYGGGLSEGFLTKINAAGDALVYSTYLGGDTFDEMRDVAVDSTGSAYVAGRSTSSNFATVNPIQATFKGGGSDITISKLNPAGNAFVYSTYLGGGGGLGFEAPFGIAVDATGNAYITGQVSSTDFPTASPIQATFGGGSPTGDAFVTKINAAGNALVYSTYLGGSGNDAGFGIVVDSAGNAYVAGQTSSPTTFPIANALQGTFGGGGSDAFLTKINPAGNAYVYSTYFGGSGDESFNEIALDSASNVYAAGATNSTNYPTVSATQAAFGGGTGDAVLTKINAAGSVLLFSTYLGGGDFDRGNALAVDSSGNAYVAGLTASTNFTTLNPVQAANAGGNDAFVTKLDPSIAAAPVANDDAYSTAEDTVLTVAAPGVLANDKTAIGTLRAILVTQPAHGTLAFNSNGSFTYTPAANYNGPDSFTYKANNGTSDSNTATVSITVGAVNDAPVNVVPGAQTLNGSTPLTFSAANSNAITVSDIDAGPASVRVTLTATNGTLSLSSTFGLVFTTGDGTSDATMTFTGALSSINGALNGLTFTPTAGFSGAASLQITTDDLGNTGTGGALSDTDSVSITVNQRTLQFSATVYTVGEAQGSATITVTRTGDTTAQATVDYETSDPSGLNNCDVNTGDASARCDYTAMGGTLTFAAGESSKTFTVPVIDDVYVEGLEHLTLTLSNPTGGVLGIPSTVLLNITDDDNTAGAPNPINTRPFFIRQLYLDVLNREPEPSGLAAWLNRLNTCPQPGETIQNCDEIEVASAFFRSPEFFDRAYFIYKVYEVAFGRQPQYEEYQRDLRKVTGFLTTEELNARKQAFVLEVRERQEFRNRYDAIVDSAAFVDALLQTAGLQLDATTRALLISQLANSQIQRWDVLRRVVESPQASQKFFNKAFVVVGYFAFLRRNPDINYLHWIDVLNTTGDYREMIRGFIQSSEYRLRFGPI